MLRGILGCATLLFLISIAINEGSCQLGLHDTVATNATGVRTSGSGPPTRDDDDDDFVPYQGERFNVFDWMLFRAMGKRYPGNLLISPISVKIALVLLYEGAQDQTAHELAGVMQLPASKSATRDKFSTILRSLETTSPAYTFNGGTRIYVDSNILTRQRYEAIAKTFYNTDVVEGNFSDVRAIASGINSWVANVTDGNIENLIENGDSLKDSLMVIVNALFFKGAWRRKYFSPENTKIEKFYVTADRTVDVPFMHTHGRFYYAESAELDAKILRIPYEGHKFAIYLILPNTLNGADRLTSEINPFVLTRHIWLMQDLPVDVSIPKFKFDFSSHLESVLRELGIRDIFDDTATLTGIARTRRTSKHLKVSDILQKTGIELNENGTLAYAATVVQLGNKIEDETFHANRPFLFYIEDESTGTIVYVGKVANPQESSGNSSPSGEQNFSSKFGEGSSNADYQPGLNTQDRDNFFSLHFQQALNEERKGNVISSPANAKLALTILTEGSAGNTRDELVSALRLPKDSSSLKKVAHRLLASLKRKEEGTEIESANGLWFHQALAVRNDYKELLETLYEANVQSVNFEDSVNTGRLIDDWVRRATRDKLSFASTNLSPDTRLALTSVVYFKGVWLKSFDRNKTTVRCFHVPDAGCRNISFMEHESMYRYAYIPSLDAQVLEIPYSDHKTAMLTFLPMQRGNDPFLRIFSKDLSYVPVSAVLASLWETGVTIRVPKFTIENKHDLKSTLQRLGIESIFGITSNLTKMVTGAPPQVTDIVQSAKIEIDEEGTLAAAETEIQFVPLSLTKHEVSLDRPFLFMIVDLAAKSILFSGRFTGPSET